MNTHDLARPALYVADAASGVAIKLLDFVTRFLDGGDRLPPEVVTRSQEIVRKRRAEAALERISESVARGENLRASDLGHLTPNHLENIRQKGDAYIRSLIEDMQRDQELRDDYRRTRER